MRRPTFVRGLNIDLHCDPMSDSGREARGPREHDEALERIVSEVRQRVAVPVALLRLNAIDTPATT